VSHGELSARIKDSVIEGEIMNKEESISVSNHEMLKALKGKYLCAQKQLQQARSKWQRRRFKEHFDDLQMNLAWTLLDCGKHEEGLALYISVCGRQYRERKYNGIGRALTEMKHYAYSAEFGHLFRWKAATCSD
jgi:hypothetical protein